MAVVDQRSNLIESGTATPRSQAVSRLSTTRPNTDPVQQILPVWAILLSGLQLVYIVRGFTSLVGLSCLNRNTLASRLCPLGPGCRFGHVSYPNATLLHACTPCLNPCSHSQSPPPSLLPVLFTHSAFLLRAHWLAKPSSLTPFESDKKSSASSHPWEKPGPKAAGFGDPPCDFQYEVCDPNQAIRPGSMKAFWQTHLVHHSIPDP